MDNDYDYLTIGQRNARFHAVMDALFSGEDKISFIKAVRDYTGLGLRESKALCDRFHGDIASSKASVERAADLARREAAMNTAYAEDVAAFQAKWGNRAHIVPTNNGWLS